MPGGSLPSNGSSRANRRCECPAVCSRAGASVESGELENAFQQVSTSRTCPASSATRSRCRTSTGATASRSAAWPRSTPRGRAVAGRRRLRHQLRRAPAASGSSARAAAALDGARHALHRAIPSGVGWQRTSCARASSTACCPGRALGGGARLRRRRRPGAHRGGRALRRRRAARGLGARQRARPAAARLARLRQPLLRARHVAEIYDEAARAVRAARTSPC